MGQHLENYSVSWKKQQILSLYRCPRRKGQNYWRWYISHSKQKEYIYMCSFLHCFGVRCISLYSNTGHTVQTSNTPCPYVSCEVHRGWQWDFQKHILLANNTSNNKKPASETVHNISFTSTILELYSETVLSWKVFGIRDMYMHIFLPRMANTITS
jgi:hypothetical protein